MTNRYASYLGLPLLLAASIAAPASAEVVKADADGFVTEDPDSEKVTFEGSVEHMRVIQAFPEKVLRMRGGLGPLQSEPATGVLTIAIGENEDGGSVIVWEYDVGTRGRG